MRFRVCPSSAHLYSRARRFALPVFPRNEYADRRSPARSGELRTAVFERAGVSGLPRSKIDRVLPVSCGACGAALRSSLLGVSQKKIGGSGSRIRPLPLGGELLGHFW